MEKRITSKVMASAAALMLGMGLTACNDDSAPSPSPATPTPTPASPTPTPGTPTPAPATPTPAPGTPTPTPAPAAPTPAPGGGGGGSAASECLNHALNTVGTQWHLEYQVSGLATGTSVSDASNVRNTTFAGKNALETEVTTVTSYSGLPSVTTVVKSYATLMPDNTIETYGTVSEVTSPLTGTITTTNDPVYINRQWTLAVGASDAYTITSTTVSAFTGLPPSTTTGTTNGTVTYLGRESVTVPAGTFNACKFELTEGNSTSTIWYSTSGAAVRTTTVSPDGSLNLALTSGTVNGAAIQ